MKPTFYTSAVQQAVRHFWGSRSGAGEKQATSEDSDRGERANVTAGKHLDGFAEFFTSLTRAVALPQPVIKKAAQLNSLPGFFRPTKKWDLLIHSNDRLLAVIELKSHVGPSFGNNCNNRAEEALGNATDFWTAYREGAYGKSPRPFLGYLMLLEDCPAVHAKPARPIKPSYFDVFPEFKTASYAERYRLLCEKLVLESLYTSAALVLSPRTAVATGEFTELSEATGLGTFISELRGKLIANSSEDTPMSVLIREEPA